MPLWTDALALATHSRSNGPHTAAFLGPFPTQADESDPLHRDRKPTLD